MSHQDGANRRFADHWRALKRLHENFVLVNAIGLSCRQVVNQQISQLGGAVPWEVVRKIGDLS